MLFKIRAATFETNSSSAHAFVVFEDQSLQDAWQSNPDVLIMLEGEGWIDTYEIDRWDALDESRLIEVNSDRVIEKYGSEWNWAVEDLKERWQKDFYELSDTGISEEIALWYELVPYDMSGFTDMEIYDGILTARLADSSAQDSQGRDVFTIVRAT